MGNSGSKPPKVFFDTDVVINWLAKEVDPETGEKLWVAPYRIIKLLEGGEVEGYSSLINIMEIRFVLRRKKDHSEEKIRELLEEFREKFIVEVPDNLDLLEADKLQREYPLDPFDSIYFALSEIITNEILLTRDEDFQEIIEESDIKVTSMNPEQFLKTKFPEKYRKDF